MDSSNQSFTLFSQQTDSDLSRQELTDALNNENLFTDKDSTQGIIQHMNSNYIELVKQIEMQKNDTEKAIYDQNIDYYIKQLEQGFDTLTNQFDNEDMLSSSFARSDAYKKLLQQKNRYMKLYNQQTIELNNALNFQRESIDALARLKVEYNDYKRQKDGYIDLSIIKTDIKEHFEKIYNKLKKFNSTIEAKTFSLENKVSHIVSRINPVSSESKPAPKQSVISVNDLIDLYDSNEGHSVVSNKHSNIYNTPLRSKSNIYNNSKSIAKPLLISETASIIDLQSKLKATRDIILNEKNEARLLKIRCDASQKEIDQWKKHYCETEIEYKQYKANAKLEIEDLRSYIAREQQNSQQATSIISLLKEDNSKLLQNAQQYLAEIASKNHIIQYNADEKQQLLNEKCDLEEELKIKEDEISTLYYQNNLLGIKIKGLTLRVRGEDKESKGTSTPLKSNYRVENSVNNLNDFMCTSIKENEEAACNKYPASVFAEFINQYKELNSGASDNLNASECIAEVMDVLKAYIKESKAFWNRMVLQSANI